MISVKVIWAKVSVKECRDIQSFPLNHDRRLLKNGVDETSFGLSITNVDSSANVGSDVDAESRVFSDQVGGKSRTEIFRVGASSLLRTRPNQSPGHLRCQSSAGMRTTFPSSWPLGRVKRTKAVANVSL